MDEAVLVDDHEGDGSIAQSRTASFTSISKEGMERYPEVISLTPPSPAGEHLAERTDHGSALMVMRRQQVKPVSQNSNDEASVASYGSATSASRRVQRQKMEQKSPLFTEMKRTSSWASMPEDGLAGPGRERTDARGDASNATSTASSKEVGKGLADGNGTNSTSKSTKTSGSGKKKKGDQRLRSKSLPSRSNSRRKKIQSATAPSSPTTTREETTMSHDPMTNRASNKSLKNVSFSSLQIRLYDREVGDNPSCSAGPPIGIGWKYQTFYTSVGSNTPSERENRVKKTELVISVDKYEITRGPRRPSHQLVLPRETREEMLLENGVSRGRIADAVRNNIRIKNQRRQTVHNLPFGDMEELMERTARTCRRMFIFNREKRRELRSRYMYEDWKKMEKRLKRKGIKLEATTKKGILVRKSRVDASRDTKSEGRNKQSGGRGLGLSKKESFMRRSSTGSASRVTNTSTRGRDNQSRRSSGGLKMERNPPLDLPSDHLYH